MSAKVMLGAMVTVSVLAVAWGARDRKKPAPAPTRKAVTEVPWLSKEAAAQIVGESGTLGPLFANMTLGSLAPSVEERERIAAFAREHDVAIDLEVVDDELVAIRFDVSYSGCCGYEGAEVLALRARRPTTGGGCVGGPERWVNDWAIANDDGTTVRARVDINRVTFRWERTLTPDELLDRASELLGNDTSTLARTQGDRWKSLSQQKYALEVPYNQDYWEWGYGNPMGMQITADRGLVSELTITVRQTDDKRIDKTLKAHFGRPSFRDDTWIWRKGDRIIEADVDNDRSVATVTMRRRAV